MKKYKKGVVVRRLRIKFAKLIKLRDQKCVRCGREDGSLQASHIFPKGSYPSMQFLPENAKLLCYQCHAIFWHLNPILATGWIKKYLGMEQYRLLVETSQRTRSVDRLFLEKTELWLKEWESELTAEAS